MEDAVKSSEEVRGSLSESEGISFGRFRTWITAGLKFQSPFISFCFSHGHKCFSNKILIFYVHVDQEFRDLNC